MSLEAFRRAPRSVLGASRVDFGGLLGPFGGILGTILGLAKRLLNDFVLFCKTFKFIVRYCKIDDPGPSISFKK